jgi:epoxyqueuosine reductase
LNRLAREIRREASRQGFSLCGFAPVRVPPHAEFVRGWLDAGNAAGMAYIEKGYRRRVDPRLILPEVRTIVTLAYPYAAPPAADPAWRERLRGRVAAYAAGVDYHRTVLGALDRVAAAIRVRVAGSRVLTYVDTGAILEREWANLGGLGWFGKNTMLLHRLGGSWFFLGEILTDLVFEADPLVDDHCGTCRRCLDACPTGALADGYRLDARLCISYLTIEHRGPIPRELRARMGNWIFGCDVCQEVCPWNAHGGSSAAVELLQPHLPELLALDESAFAARFRHTALWRAKRDGLLRNVAVALGNTGNAEAVPPLARALGADPSPLVRGHAAWALGELGGAAARAALERARGDRDEWVRSEIESALAARA